MTTSFAPLTVAIGDLVPHPANVRSNSPETYDSENIAHLKASIAVLGLLQPLLVQKIDGKYAVLAGGRRHAALKELVADKAAKGFTAKTKIDCRLVPEDCDVTTALSLAENITHLRSNGIDGTTTRIVTTEQADPSFAFADGMNPFRDTDWMAQRRMAFRDMTGQFYTDILDDVQVLIDRGRGAIRLATDGHSIRVFVRRASDYLIGGTYEVPSGLGGTFRVILKDACDTFAIVQNCGNSAFWEFEDDETAPMSRERAARQGIGASPYSHKRCEDFDAMQPYRVPLDALMEIDDRRVA